MLLLQELQAFFPNVRPFPSNQVHVHSVGQTQSFQQPKNCWVIFDSIRSLENCPLFQLNPPSNRSVLGGHDLSNGVLFSSVNHSETMTANSEVAGKAEAWVGGLAIACSADCISRLSCEPATNKTEGDGKWRPTTVRPTSIRFQQSNTADYITFPSLELRSIVWLFLYAKEVTYASSI